VSERERECEEERERGKKNVPIPNKPLDGIRAQSA